ncbi:unnamed protein product [Heterobilharzia americana]|nr:unnamed protein product [Heterobilharzia americana]
MFILLFLVDYIYFSTLWFTVKCEIKLLNIDNSKTNNEVSLNFKHRIQLHLNDNTPANYLIGNILNGNYIKHQQETRQPTKFIRSMLIPDTYFI